MCARVFGRLIVAQKSCRDKLDRPNTAINQVQLK